MIGLHGSSFYINEIHFINDHDDTQSNPGKLILACLGISHQIFQLLLSIYCFENIETRNEQESQVVSIAFSSTIQDTDYTIFLFLGFR